MVVNIGWLFLLVIVWFKDEELVVFSFYFEILYDCDYFKLMVYYVILEDFGIYKCVVISVMVIIIKKFFFNIEGNVIFF